MTIEIFLTTILMYSTGVTFYIFWGWAFYMHGYSYGQEESRKFWENES